MWIVPNPMLNSRVIITINFRCTNADPNYGTAWFFCRFRPFDTPNAVIRAAHDIIVHEMTSTQSVYVNAVVQYVQRVLSNSLSKSTVIGVIPEVTQEWWMTTLNEVSNEQQTRQPSNGGVKPFVRVDIDSDGKGGTILSSQDFVTSLIKLNRLVYTRHNSAEERRKLLFGVDQITP